MVLRMPLPVHSMIVVGGRCRAVLGLLLVATMLGCGAKPPSRVSTAQFEPEKPRVKVGLSVPASTYLPLYLAADASLFSQEGLQVDLLEFRGGMDLIKALVAGSIDIGVVSLVEVTAGIDAGQPLKAFYAGFNFPMFDWYAVPSIKSLAAARGKRFGVAQYGSSTDFLTRYVLKVNGIDPGKDAQIVQGGDSATRLAAMQAGQLDANILAAPEKFIAAERGYNLIFQQKSLAADYPYHVIVANESFLSRDPNTVKAFLRGHVRGLRFAKRDKQRAIQTLTRHLHIDAKYLGPTYDELIDDLYEDGRLPSEKALELFFDMGIQAGRYKARWPREKYWTTAYVDTYNQWKPASPQNQP